MAEHKAYDLLKTHFPAAVRGVVEFRGETTVAIEKGHLRAVMTFLKESEALRYDLLVDLAGVDLGSESPRFKVAYLLHSLKFNNRLRIETRVADGEEIETLSDIWKAANWMEREVYDLFGIKFSRHPDLRRILMPEDAAGHPLRKDFPLKGFDFDRPFPVCLEEEKGNKIDA